MQPTCGTSIAALWGGIERDFDRLRKQWGEDHSIVRCLAPDLDALRALVPKGASGEFDTAAWDALSVADRELIAGKLCRMQDALERAIGDEPTDAGSLMYRTHVSNRTVVLLTVFAALGTLGVLRAVVRHWGPAVGGPRGEASIERSLDGSPAPPATAAPPVGSGPGASEAGEAAKPAASNTKSVDRHPPTEIDVLEMILLMGLLGGFLHTTSSLAIYIGNRRLLRSWIVYYLLMPVEGAALAPITYLLLRVGVLAPATNEASTGNLNLLGLYAFAALTGLFSKQAIEMLADVFGRIFKKVEAKDPADDVAPSEKS